MGDIPRDKLSGALRRGAVKKHVAAIHVSGKLTLLQRKRSNVLLLNAYDTLTSQSPHQIDARTLSLMIGYNSNDLIHTGCPADALPAADIFYLPSPYIVLPVRFQSPDVPGYNYFPG